jgi:hypothetical protein
MKNHGYELEHNFGHGETFLAMTLAALNLLAFAWHSVLDLVEPKWQAARQAAAKRSSFFAHMLTLTTYVVFPSWPTFLSPGHLHDPPVAAPNPENRIRPGRHPLLELLTRYIANLQTLENVLMFFSCFRDRTGH